MLRDFLALGYSEDVFWTLTPYKYSLYVEAAVSRQIQEHNRQVELSFIAGYYSRAEKPKTIDKFFKENPFEKTATKKDQKADLDVRLAQVMFSLKPKKRISAEDALKLMQNARGVDSA